MSTIQKSLDLVQSKQDIQDVITATKEKLKYSTSTTRDKERIKDSRRALSDKEKDEESDDTDSLTPKRHSRFFPSRVFGTKLFRTNLYESFFQSNLNIATPTNYVLGPRDQLVMSLFGLQELYYSGFISWDGIYDIPNVGPVFLTGVTMEEAEGRILSKLIKAGYVSIQNNKSQLVLSVGNIRTIQVMITGEVLQPGSYALPSLSTVFNALFACNGPTDKGSFRKIQLIRNNKLYKEIDVYDFLIGGDRSSDVNLQDQDIIYVPYAKRIVDIQGEVQRSQLFELDSADNMLDLLDFAVGFTPDAYKRYIKVVRQTDTGVSYVDVPKEGFASFTFEPFDKVIVELKTIKMSNYVQIEGEVYRPGGYPLTEGMSLRSLLERAGGLKPSASVDRALIVRMRDDRTQKMLPVNLADILSGKSGDIILLRMDKIIIADRKNISRGATISIYGEVESEGVYPFIDSLTVQDAILLAGGFSRPTASYRVEVSSRIFNSRSNYKNDNRISKVLLIDNVNDTDNTIVNTFLKPYDVLTVYKRSSVYEHQSIYVEGEVIYPGSYTLRTKNETIYQMLQRVGGLTDFAHIPGAYIKRTHYGSNFTSSILPIIQSVSSKDTLYSLTYKQKHERQFYAFKIPLDLGALLENPQSSQNITFVDGDTLVIPKTELTVKVTGEVHNETILPYRAGKRLNYYFQSAGGTNANAIKRKSYIIYPNGKAKPVKSFLLFFRKYPKVLPGSEIVVPSKSVYPTKLGDITAAAAATSSILTSVALIYSTFIRR